MIEQTGLTKCDEGPRTFHPFVSLSCSKRVFAIPQKFIAYEAMLAEKRIGQLIGCSGMANHNASLKLCSS